MSYLRTSVYEISSLKNRRRMDVVRPVDFSLHKPKDVEPLGQRATVKGIEQRTFWGMRC